MWRLEFSSKMQGAQKRTKRVERFLCRKAAQRPVVYTSYAGEQLSDTEAKRKPGQWEKVQINNSKINAKENKARGFMLR